MGLTAYKKKRSFDQTTEPTGGKSGGSKLRFVVQKHDASRLHYDFRLEMAGVLKSWAVPKGPSMDPSVKRLAMMVEDHPYDYKDFEGIIPEGNYGAGTVIVWDEGTYEPIETETGTKQSQEKQLLAALKKQRLKFTLHGKKLKGAFALVKSGFGEANAWLLMKIEDKYASADDITAKDKSVISRKTIEQVEKANGRSTIKKTAVKKTAVAKTGSKTAGVKKAAKKAVASKKASGSVLIPTDEKEAVIKIKGHAIKLTNLNKTYWPVEKLTKRNLLNYYAEMAPYIMPYLKNRPQSLNRHPDGIDKPNFFQKNMPETIPDWIDTLAYKSDSDNRTTNYMVCKTEADLLYMASLGCIEINPWHSRVPKVDNPDWCVIDLDPDTNTFNKVIETALMVKQVLDSVGAESYCKTSGSTGLHIYIPLGGKYNYEQSRMLAQLVVQMVQRELHSFTSIERSPAKRKGKIYLDYLQNKSTQTIAAPYSLRPKPGAPVSTPVFWEEVKPGLKIKDHNIYNIRARVEEIGDIFQPVLAKGIDLRKVLRQMEAMG